MTTAGIVLAVGKSRRFGSDKAFAVHEGRFFYEKAVDALSAVTGTIIMAARKEFIHKITGDVLVIEDLDEVSGLGPLAGIYSAMEAVDADAYIVLPCDMPYTEGIHLSRLCALQGQEDILLVEDGGRMQPFPGIYKGSVKPLIKELLSARKLRMSDLYELVQVRCVQSKAVSSSPEQVFRNINTPQGKEWG